jgi:head-tail adaptor
MSEFAGTLRTRVEIWEDSAERSTNGLSVGEWTRVARCLARVEPDGFGALEEGMALSASQRFRVTIRFTEGVAVGQQVRVPGQRLIVRQVYADRNKSDRLTLRCEELRS